jgi:hypothetical protein
MSATSTDPTGDATGACINIGPRERAGRMRFGVISLVLSVVGAGLVIGLGAPRAARLAIVPLLIVSAFGFFQAFEKTCVANVRRDVKNLDDGDVAITDPLERATLRRQGRKVTIESFLAVAVATAILMLL